MRLPWKVVYNPEFDEWHPKSCPIIVDCDGNLVIRAPQSIGIDHPGEYDEVADNTCHIIVSAVNKEYNV